MNTTAITPDDLEMVTLADLTPGDVIVSFTPANKKISVPATPRQLRLRTTSWVRIARTIPGTTRYGISILESFDDNDVSVSFGLPTANVWRVRADRLDNIN